MEDTAISSFPEVLRRGGDTANPARYAILGYLGGGAFGSALLVEPTNVPDGVSRRRYVAKIVDMSQMNEKNRQYAKLEIQTLSVCKHYGVVGYIQDHASADGSKLLLIMEFADAGDLSRQINARDAEKQRFQEPEAAFLFVQILLALDYLHRNRILHRDLKAANVFLTVNGAIKLGDFGFSQQYEQTVSQDVAGTFLGTPYYIAPEVWRSKKYSKKADVWSLGVVVHQTCSLAAPFKGSSMAHLMKAILDGVRAPLAPLGFPHLEPVVAWMLTVDPYKRPSTRHVLHHPYVLHATEQLAIAIGNNPAFPAEVRAQVAADVAFVKANPPPELSLIQLPSVNDVGFEQAGAIYIAQLNAIAEQQQAAALRPDGRSAPSVQGDTALEAAAAPVPGGEGVDDPMPAVTSPHIRLDIAHEGHVKHHSSGVWKNRYLKLERGTIVVCILRDGRITGLKRVSLDHVRGVFPVSPQHAQGEEHAFAIEIVGGRSLLQAPSEADRDTWLQKLQTALGEEGV